MTGYPLSFVTHSAYGSHLPRDRRCQPTSDPLLRRVHCMADFASFCVAETHKGRKIHPQDTHIGNVSTDSLCQVCTVVFLCWVVWQDCRLVVVPRPFLLTAILAWGYFWSKSSSAGCPSLCQPLRTLLSPKRERASQGGLPTPVSSSVSFS